MDASPSIRTLGYSERATRSVGARPQKPAQIHADAERVAIELKRNAAAKVKFKVKVAYRFVINTGAVSVVAREVRRARRDAAGGEAGAVSAAAAPAALCCSATEDPADFRLISPGRDVVGRDRKAEFAGIVFDAAVKLRVVTVGHERTMEKLRVHDAVADSGVDERREISEGV